MTTPTTPTNRPPDDELEARLQASFERATRQAEADLADGRLAAGAINRGRRRTRRAPALRAGLVLVAVAVLGAGTLWAVGSRPSPSPSPSSIANAETPHPSEVPTDANGSQFPQEAPPTRVPDVDEGSSFPPAVNGLPVFAVGGPAEAHIAAATDATPFYVSGWYIPLGRRSCWVDGFASIQPGQTAFAPCETDALFAGPDGGPSVQYLLTVTSNGPTGLGDTVDRHDTTVNRWLIKVHLHDPACTLPECATRPILDEIAMTGTPRLNPVLVMASPPPNATSAEAAIAAAEAYTADQHRTGGSVLHLMIASLGTAAVLGDDNRQDENPIAWEWKVVFGSEDGLEVVTVWVDAVSGVIGHSDSQLGGGTGVSVP